jgi:hypothetical protein
MKNINNRKFLLYRQQNIFFLSYVLLFCILLSTTIRKHTDNITEYTDNKF